MRPLGIGMVVSALCCALGAKGGEWAVQSPRGGVVISVGLGEPADGGRLSYAVKCDGAVVVEESPLGIVRTDGAFDAGLSLETAGESATHDSTYTVVHGKRREVRDDYRERVLEFRNAAGGRLELVLRAYDDGVAFRYRFPERDDAVRTVSAERTGFQLAREARVWAMPFDEPNVYNPAYENFWQDAIEPGTASPTKAGWTLPLLFQTPGGCWGLITEAAADGTYCGGRLAGDAPEGLYRWRFPEPGEGNGVGDVEPSSTLPWATPWRLIVVGKSLAAIVETNLVENLAPASIVADTSWVKPGRVSWSWLFDPDSPQDFTKLKEFVDLAAEMGWEYTLVDANWDIMRNGTIHDLIAYAATKGVGVMLWYNSGGPHNAVTERPRGLMDQRRIRRYEFERLAKWGVKGVKIDFFQSDKPGVMGLYHEILKDAADFRIMVNFHGCTLPRGWSRTYPHLMSMEAVRGEENYQFEPRFPAYAPRHNATLPFTRNAVGPMDYTPVMFRDNKHALVTTAGHEIALPVVFESGLLHFAGGPPEYRALPDAPKEFLKRVPVAWDETRFLDGDPGRYVVLARRVGRTWYVGGLNGSAEPREVELRTESLGAGPWRASLIEDGKEAKSLASRSVEIGAGGSIRLTLRPNGGFVGTLEPLTR